MKLPGNAIFSSESGIIESTAVKEPFHQVRVHLQNAIERGTFPGAQLVIGEGGEIIAEAALGYAVIEPEQIPVTQHTIYDLASLTKPLITTLLTVMLAERGLLDLSAPASHYLEELCVGNKRAITLMQLLTHTSGLPAWRPLYLEAQNRADMVTTIAHTPCEKRYNAESAPLVIYSDLNFILLGFILERVTGDRLDRLAQKEIFQSLGLTKTFFNPAPERQRQIAATEFGQAHERKTVAEMKIVCPAPINLSNDKLYPLRRKLLLWGEVHDGNAYFMEGVAGHAGLFSTAREVFSIASQFISGSKLLQNESLSLFTQNFTQGHGDARSVGWMLAATKACSAGRRLPDDAFGHTGFTGTSVWIDGQKQLVFILLTNRVHPQVHDFGMKQVRQQFHTLAIEALNHRRSLDMKTTDFTISSEPSRIPKKP
jgi:serine-type D-Ala-D-Ala carboxypeptidase